MTVDATAVHPFAGWDVAALIEARGRQRGAHPALIWAPFEGPAQVWSYAGFAEAVARIAGGLAARGIVPAIACSCIWRTVRRPCLPGSPAPGSAPPRC